MKVSLPFTRSFGNPVTTIDISMKFLTQVPKNRTDLLPHYSRLVATLNKYMPDIGSDLVAFVS